MHALSFTHIALPVNLSCSHFCYMCTNVRLLLTKRRAHCLYACFQNIRCSFACRWAPIIYYVAGHFSVFSVIFFITNNFCRFFVIFFIFYITFRGEIPLDQCTLVCVVAWLSFATFQILQLVSVRNK